MEINNIKKDKIKNIINEYVLVKKNINEKFFFTDGDSKYIFDFRNAFTKGDLLFDLCNFFWDIYEDEYPFQVGGLETGSIPFISGISIVGNMRGKKINTFYVRKNRKETGLGKKIEGELNSEKIIIVDDLINSGGSVLKVYNSIPTKFQKNIFKVFVFLNFGSEKLKDSFYSKGLDLDYTFTLSDFGLSNISKPSYKGRNNYPKITPFHKLIGSLENSNRFLIYSKSNPIKDGKFIYFGNEGGKLAKLCLDTGLIINYFSVDLSYGHKNILSSPIIYGEKLFLGSYDGNLYCLDKNNFKGFWKNYIADWISSTPCIGEKENLLFIGFEHGGKSNKGSVAGVNLDTGNTSWQVFFNDYIASSPGYNSKYGLVYCGTNDGKLFCGRADNGKQIFVRFFDSEIKSGFSFSQDFTKVFFGCFDNNFYCLNSLNGKVLWKYTTGNIVTNKGFIIGENVFFGSTDKSFYHLNINGELLKKIDTSGKIFTDPIFIKDGIIAFGSNDSFVYFYDYKNTRLLFRFEHYEKIASDLIYDNESGILYVLDFMGGLYKYDILKFIE